MSKAPFPIDAHLTAIAIAYRNSSMIADEVLPRVPVGKAEFKWWEYDLGQGFTVPNTNVGRTSQPNQVEFNAEEKPHRPTTMAWMHRYHSPISIMRRRTMIRWDELQSVPRT